jgi:hypothetical protein
MLDVYLGPSVLFDTGGLSRPARWFVLQFVPGGPPAAFLLIVGGSSAVWIILLSCVAYALLPRLKRRLTSR